MLSYNWCPSAEPKTQLMITRTFLTRLFVLAFMILVGYSLARAIQYQSVMGIILASTSLGAVIYFLHLLAKMKYEQDQQKENV